MDHLIDSDPTTVRALREENRTLSGVIRLVSSSLEPRTMLQGIVDLATEAAGSHACFIYLLDGGRVTVRAASPVFADAVDEVSFPVDEGLTGWVARHQQPAFIRDHAMDDPRMKYVPLLREEDFQSMVAVPILSRAGDTIGVIVLHTRAPHEFSETTVSLLEHIASLVGGAVENTQLYAAQRRRVDSLTRLSGLAQEVAGAADRTTLSRIVVTATREILGAALCQLYRLDDPGDDLTMLASSPEAAPTTSALSSTNVLLAALEGRGTGAAARTLWPQLTDSELLVTPLSVGAERVGLLCLGSAAGAQFSSEDAELARAIAHLSAVALKRTELIDSLTKANAVKDVFEALAAGADRFAAAKAAEIGCDLSRPYVVVHCEPIAGREHGSSEWRAAAARFASELATIGAATAIEAGPGPVRGLLVLRGRPAQADEVLRECRALAARCQVVVGISAMCGAPTEGPRAYREAVDAATIGRALSSEGGAIAYSELGAYRYLVHISPDEAPHDRMRAAVDRLIDYDTRRRTALLDTLERYLAERRSVIESARSLYIHPNTLRQRLARVEELTGLDLEHDDLLSLELAIKLARMHGRPTGTGRSAPAARTG